MGEGKKEYRSIRAPAATSRDERVSAGECKHGEQEQKCTSHRMHATQSFDSTQDGESAFGGSERSRKS
jgi:hypothetical protein